MSLVNRLWNRIYILSCSDEWELILVYFGPCLTTISLEKKKKKKQLGLDMFLKSVIKGKEIFRGFSI